MITVNTSVRETHEQLWRLVGEWFALCGPKVSDANVLEMLLRAARNGEVQADRNGHVAHEMFWAALRSFIEAHRDEPEDAVSHLILVSQGEPELRDKVAKAELLPTLVG